MTPRSRRVSVALGATVAGLALAALVALALGPSSSSVSSAVENDANLTSGPIALLSSLQDQERTDPKFAACVNQLRGEGMELVMQVDSSCGDVFTASQCSAECHTAAIAFADSMGCCWPHLITGFSKVQPAASHAWHGWVFNLENLCGVSMAGRCQSEAYLHEKSEADDAVSVAQSALERAKQEAATAESSRRAALLAAAQAKKLQKEMAREMAQFRHMRKSFTQSRADAARAALVERMVHNAVQKDLSKAWGVHKAVDRDRKLARKLAAGTQVQQANARALLKSAHAAKKSVFQMARLANAAKKAAFRLHKLALKDIVRAKRTEKRAQLQKQIADKAAKDVKRQLRMSNKIISQSQKEQNKAKKLWGALEDEQKGLEEEKKEAASGAEDEEDIDKKMDAEISEAEAKFAGFSKEAEGVEEAVSNAEELAEKAATISAQSENLLTQTKTQQDEIDKERGWLMQQEAQVLAGRKGVAALEGEIDVLKHKYLNLRRAFAGIEYATRSIPSHMGPVHYAADALTPYQAGGGVQGPEGQRVGLYHYHREGEIYPDNSEHHREEAESWLMPMPPRRGGVF